MKARRIVIGIILLCLAACGGGGDTDGVTTIRMVVWKPNVPAAWDSALTMFHRAHPEIRIEREIGPHSSTQFHDLLTQKLRNRDPSVDVFLMDVIWTPEFAQAGWARPLRERFPITEQSEFFAGCIRADRWRGEIFGVPLNIDAGVLYYRKDLLEKYGFAPPETWSEMIAQADSIRRAEDDPRLGGYSGQFRQYEGLICDMLEFIHSNGGELIDPSSDAAVAAVQFVRDSVIGHVGSRGLLTYSEQESLDLFISGGALFHRNWPYAWSVCKESPLDGKVGIARLPAFAGGASASALGGWRMGISAYSRKVDAAWKVVAFFTSPAMQRHFAVTAGRAPARRALYRDPQVLAANPHFAEFFPVFETATPRPQSPLYPEVSHILQRYLHTALSESGADIPSLASSAATDIQKALSRIP